MGLKLFSESQGDSYNYHLRFFKKVFHEILGFVMRGQNVSRDDAIAELATILEDHYPHPVSVCECADVYPDDHPLGGEGRIQPLDVSWEFHVAEIAFEAAKGF